MDLKKLYTDPRGRINRKTWWLGLIGLIIIALIVNMAIGIVGAAFGLGNTLFGLGLMSLVSFVVLLLPYYALTVKRLHDRSRTTALFWVFCAPSILTAFLMMLGVSGSIEMVEMFGQQTPAYRPNLVGNAVSVFSAAIGIWALVELGFLKGQAGDNAYGPDPLGRAKPTA